MNKSYTLRFGSEGNKRGKFRILMISDFHERPRNRPVMTDRMIEGIEALLLETKPDMVLIGGDQCVDARTTEGIKEHMEYMLSPILKRGLPWATVFGNHDREDGHDIALEQSVYETIPGCLSTAGPEEVSGVGNFCIPILSSKDDSVAFHIWGLDTHYDWNPFLIEKFNLPKDTKVVLPDHFCHGENATGVLPDQVMWYYNESVKREKEAGKKIPAIMMMHIAPPEMCLIERNPEETNACGNKRYAVGAPELNSGLFMACLQRGDVKGIFFGHEHHNDFEGQYCGITLGYDACVGYNMTAHDDTRGGRVIELFEEGTIDTYSVKLMDIMGERAVRDPVFEGGCKYNFRTIR